MYAYVRYDDGGGHHDDQDHELDDDDDDEDDHGPTFTARPQCPDLSLLRPDLHTEVEGHCRRRPLQLLVWMIGALQAASRHRGQQHT